MDKKPPASRERSRMRRFLSAVKIVVRGVLRGLQWFVFGIPSDKRLRGKWVYNARDKTWRYYVEDWV